MFCEPRHPASQLRCCSGSAGGVGSRHLGHRVAVSAPSSTVSLLLGRTITREDRFAGRSLPTNWMFWQWQLSIGHWLEYHSLVSRVSNHATMQGKFRVQDGTASCSCENFTIRQWGAQCRTTRFPHSSDGTAARTDYHYLTGFPTDVHRHGCPPQERTRASPRRNADTMVLRLGLPCLRRDLPHLQKDISLRAVAFCAVGAGKTSGASFGVPPSC